MQSVWIGFDLREAAAFMVAKASIQYNLNVPIPCYGLMLNMLRADGLYHRPTELRDGRLYDVISEHPMATEFAISRFLTPYLHRRIFGNQGWALFCDCDVMARTSLQKLFAMADSDFAVMVVKHDYAPTTVVKMDNQVQSSYVRKNWSSVVLWNVSHPANQELSVQMVNSLPGRDLHRFCWLNDSDIGELNVSWNWLAGVSPDEVVPDIVHFTEGCPCLSGYENVPYALEWWYYLRNAVGISNVHD